MPAQFQYYVFLSHNKADKPRVRVCNFAPHTLHFALPRAVLFRDPANTGRRFIPLLQADCKLRRFRFKRDLRGDYRFESLSTPQL